MSDAAEPKAAPTGDGDFLKWRWLRLERRKEYAHERYDYVALGGAFWIVERLGPEKCWIAWLIVAERVRLMNQGATPIEALDATHADAKKLDEALHGALLEIDHEAWRYGDPRGRVG